MNTVNVDTATVHGFGEEWSAFDQTAMSAQERARLFDRYFAIFPFAALPPGAQGFDFGCGSGRWAAMVAPRVGRLHCIDASPDALAVARRNLAGHANVACHPGTSQTMPLAPDSQDFGYSLGVLHHIPDTRGALRDCVTRLKPGAPFLVYLYYAFDNRPVWFRAVWGGSDLMRRAISRMPFAVKKPLTTLIAAAVYWPLARLALVLERLGLNVAAVPLSSYRGCSFYTMRTDALDRFGTRLEQRFTRARIATMMQDCGLADIAFSRDEPYWVACGRRVS